jgi:hypothetical protein
MDLIVNYLVEIMERGVLVKFLAIPARKNCPIPRCQILWCLPGSLSRVPQQHWPIADLPRLQSGCSNPLPSWLRKHCRRNQVIEFETPETLLTVDMIAPRVYSTWPFLKARKEQKMIWPGIGQIPRTPTALNYLIYKYHPKREKLMEPPINRNS